MPDMPTPALIDAGNWMMLAERGLTPIHAKVIADQWLKKCEEVQRLRNFLQIAVDDYADNNGFPTRETHWAAQAKKCLDEQQIDKNPSPNGQQERP